MVLGPKSYKGFWISVSVLLLLALSARAFRIEKQFCRELESTLVCDGFESLNQLDFTSPSIGNEREYAALVLEPVKAIRFDRSIQLKGLRLADSFNVTLINFNGFEFFANPFNSFTEQANELRIVGSTVQFYYNGHDFSAQSRACRAYQTDFGTDYVPLFSRFPRLSLDSSTILARQCSHVFQNTAIDELSITGAELSAVTRYLLNERLLNGLRYLKINSHDAKLDQIESLASSLKSLQVLQLDFDDMTLALRDGYRVDQNKWLSFSKRIDHQFMFMLHDSSKRYSLNDANICELRHLDVSGSAFSLVLSDQSLECGCAQLWLLQGFFADQTASIPDSLRCQTLTPTEYKSKFESCSFQEKFARCDEQSANSRAANARKDSADHSSSRQTTNFVIFAVLVFVILGIVLLIRWYTYERLKEKIRYLISRVTGKPLPDPHSSLALTSFANPMASFPTPAPLGTIGSNVNIIDESND